MGNHRMNNAEFTLVLIGVLSIIVIFLAGRM